jgi:hypothetical protein
VDVLLTIDPVGGYVMPLRKLLIDCVKVITLVVLGPDVFWYKLELQVGASACESRVLQ